jgi:hypothetical protein
MNRQLRNFRARDPNLATKKHKQHKKVMETVLCRLCFLWRLDYLHLL